ncbi:hypothetical protein HRI_000096100 [Hibiscus trionum]|uniref:Uncharacterized protein n=1 Tax=Hibiscus trionum TaxID=183268 RepID=A0A9W7GTV0_HIBTR|nr:hypothetical protein HRI_000096100 [Hibiscus trionum]
MGQVSQFINTRQNGGFPSDTEVTRKPTYEQCKAITTRSGKQLQGPIIKETSSKESTLQTHAENTTPTERKQHAAITSATTAENRRRRQKKLQIVSLSRSDSHVKDASKTAVLHPIFHSG